MFFGALLDAAHAQGRERHDLVQGLEVSVARSLPHVPPLAQQALALGMSERTLRRRLAEHGTSYESLVDSVRLVRAEELITASDLPLHNIAGLLGFSDARTLRRAVARWFGTSPSALCGARTRTGPVMTDAAGAPAGIPPRTTSPSSPAPELGRTRPVRSARPPHISTAERAAPRPAPDTQNRLILRIPYEPLALAPGRGAHRR
ncbi:helix-turn-helix transcriptional regulator [Streptomyces sp. NPDC018833]|uniref:helix-turn-helix transcriptional regulator n=1 Tax=Streptomyces sp. NPDC018833 TaxID=3365053 RepID=UPI0037B35000